MSTDVTTTTDGVVVLIDLGIKQEGGYLYFPRWVPRKQALEIVRAKFARAGEEKPKEEIVWSGAAPAGHPDDAYQYRVIGGKLTAHKAQ